MGFPFLFLWEAFAIDPNVNSWGPDCANPIAPDGDSRALIDDRPSQLLLFFASVFGAIHFITWSFYMPTVVELWMWRSASIALTSLPVLGALPFFVLDSDWQWVENNSFLTKMLSTWAGVCLFLHPLYRLVIAIDSVVLLRDLPDSAFLVLSWSDAIPSL